MRQSTQIKPVDVEGQPRQGTPTIAFTVGFEYENPELAMRVASEFITLIVNEDARSRTSRATEAVTILTGETKDIEDKLDSTQMQIFEIARRPREAVPEIPEQQKSQLTALAALKAELIQKTSVYSDAHPAVTALKKRIAAMEKTLTQSAAVPAKAPSTQADDIEALKRQREVLEKRLEDANSKLATARLSDKMVGMAFAAAAMAGIGAVFAPALFDRTIHGRQQLSGVVANQLIVSIPYITTRGDIIRARLRVIFSVVSVVILLLVLGGLAAAIVLHLPFDLSWFDKAGIGFRAFDY
jgi:uncharacterized protein involved in exopolysaccharide biosynthesis